MRRTQDLSNIEKKKFLRTTMLSLTIHLFFSFLIFRHEYICSFLLVLTPLSELEWTAYALWLSIIICRPLEAIDVETDFIRGRSRATAYEASADFRWIWVWKIPTNIQNLIRATVKKTNWFTDLLYLPCPLIHFDLFNFSLIIFHYL